MAKLFGEAFDVGLDCGGPELGGGFSAGDRCLSLILFTKEEGLPLETRTGDRCYETFRTLVKALDNSALFLIAVGENHTHDYELFYVGRTLMASYLTKFSHCLTKTAF